MEISVNDLMEDVKSKYQEGIKEIKEILKFIRSFEFHHNKFPASRVQISTIKASSYIMMYSLVESVITTGISKIEKHIGTSKCPPEKLNKSIRKYFAKKIKSKGEDDLEASLGEGLTAFWHAVICSRQTMEKKKNNLLIPLGKNLDENEIYKVLKDIGVKKINLEKDRTTLPSITDMKTKRNDLSHGNDIFSEIGKDLTYNDLKLSYNYISKYLKKFIKICDHYLKEKHFLEKIK